MSEMKEGSRIYKRAAIGFGIVALAWTVALVFAGRSEEEKINWLIPIAAAALSVICFSISAKSDER
jgi:hypothetical protein